MSVKDKLVRMKANRLLCTIAHDYFITLNISLLVID